MVAQIHHSMSSPRTHDELVIDMFLWAKKKWKKLLKHDLHDSKWFTSAENHEESQKKKQ